MASAELHVFTFYGTGRVTNLARPFVCPFVSYVLVVTPKRKSIGL